MDGARAATFEIVIQLGAILAVVWHYRVMLSRLVFRSFTEPAERRLTGAVVLAFLPAAVVGLVLHHWIKDHLFNELTVAAALVVGGIVMLVIEWFRPRATTSRVYDLSWKQALGIGLAQLLALIPGTSRAAATILGGYALGLTRPAATEFSFLLAIPTLVGAGALDLYRSRDLFTGADIPMFAVGLGVSFVAALVVIRGFLRFVQHHSFVPFAWYRIAFGGAILAMLVRCC